MTATWRARFTTTLGDAPIDEFETTYPSLEMRLMAAGRGTFAIPIARGDKATGRRLAALRGSGATAVYLYRNSVLWWPGLVWNIARASDEKANPAVGLECATFESYLARCQLNTDLAAMTGADQLDIGRSFIDNLQSDPNANLGFTYDTQASGIIRDRTAYTAAARPDYLRMLTESATVDGGYEFGFIATADPVSGARSRHLRLGYPTLSTGTVHRLDRPGAILSYQLLEDGTRTATYQRASGGSALSTVHTDAAALAAGYPRLDATTTYSAITDPTVLEAKATADLAAAHAPVTITSLRIRLDAAPDITPACLGDTLHIAIEDEQFPDGVTLSARMVGITVAPPERGRPEYADLTLN